MPSMLLTYVKSRDGKYYPKPQYACNICGAKYSDEDDAFDCEERGGRPKYSENDRLVFVYPNDLTTKGAMKVTKVTPVKPPFGTPHWFTYTVSFDDGDTMIVSEREVRLA